MRNAISTFFMPRYASVWLCPRPLSPATAIRMRSLAPSTLGADLVPAIVMVAAVASDFWRKLRRETRVMERLRQRGREEVGPTVERYPPAARRANAFWRTPPARAGVTHP